MNDKKKTFLVPEAEIVTFNQEDIIAESAGTNGWENDDNTEVWG